jgi:hypothetical protein
VLLFFIFVVFYIFLRNADKRHLVRGSEASRYKLCFIERSMLAMLFAWGLALLGSFEVKMHELPMETRELGLTS